MLKTDTFAVIGGDLRSATAACLLALDGYRVLHYGFNEDTKPTSPTVESSNMVSAIRASNCILLPMPLTVDGIQLNAPFCTEYITIDTILNTASPAQIIMAGRVTPEIKEKAKALGLRLYDYLEREELAVLNAIPTAEGAIQLAMEETTITLHGSNCLVTGYGRIGKVLTKMLYGIGANVTVAARKCADAAWIGANRYQFCHTSKIAGVVGKADVIFNTVPYMLFTPEILLKIQRETLIIDLASKPGGVDFTQAGRLGLKTIWALSLPGKVAPLTAGKIIKNTVINIIEEETL